VLRRSQAAGGLLPARDPTVEAWVFISLGLLGTVGRRLGGLVGDDFAKITAARSEWLNGPAVDSSS
jgi:hypothetical protein